MGSLAAVAAAIPGSLGHILIRIVRRAPMTRELADLIGRSVLVGLEYAESYPNPSGRPSGTFAHDLTAIDAVSSESAREVRGKLHATIIEIISMLLAHATDH